ncbi:MAG: hypothetical protein AAF555_03945 [Verrucomicrobiota bacterium]
MKASRVRLLCGFCFLSALSAAWSAEKPEWQETLRARGPLSILYFGNLEGGEQRLAAYLSEALSERFYYEEEVVDLATGPAGEGLSFLSLFSAESSLLLPAGVCSMERILPRPDLVVLCYRKEERFGNGFWQSAMERSLEALAAADLPVVLLAPPLRGSPTTAEGALDRESVFLWKAAAAKQALALLDPNLDERGFLEGGGDLLAWVRRAVALLSETAPLPWRIEQEPGFAPGAEVAHRLHGGPGPWGEFRLSAVGREGWLALEAMAPGLWQLPDSFGESAPQYYRFQSESLEGLLEAPRVVEPSGLSQARGEWEGPTRQAKAGSGASAGLVEFVSPVRAHGVPFALETGAGGDGYREVEMTLFSGPEALYLVLALRHFDLEEIEGKASVRLRLFLDSAHESGAALRFVGRSKVEASLEEARLPVVPLTVAPFGEGSPSGFSPEQAYAEWKTKRDGHRQLVVVLNRAVLPGLTWEESGPVGRLGLQALVDFLVTTEEEPQGSYPEGLRFGIVPDLERPPDGATLPVFDFSGEAVGSWRVVLR